MPSQAPRRKTGRQGTPQGDTTAYARMQRQRQRRKAEGWQAYALWLPPESAALLTELKQPGESLTALIARALRSLQAPATAGPSPQARKAAVVARLRQMRAAGLVYQAIADQLDAEGVPTMTGRGRWSKSVVRDLVLGR